MENGEKLKDNKLAIRAKEWTESRLKWKNNRVIDVEWKDLEMGSTNLLDRINIFLKIECKKSDWKK